MVLKLKFYLLQVKGSRSRFLPQRILGQMAHAQKHVRRF